MAPSVSLQNVASEGEVRGLDQTASERNIKQRRILLGAGSRSGRRRSNGNRIGRDTDEDSDKIHQRRQLFDPLGRLRGGVQEGGGIASKVLNGIFNPSRLASPETTTSIPPQAQPAPTTSVEDVAPVQPTTAPAPPPVQSTTVAPPPVIPTTTQAPQPTPPPQTTRPPAQQITAPVTTPSVPSLTFISAPPAIAITEQPQASIPPFLFPIDVGSGEPLEVDTPTNPATTTSPELRNGMIPGGSDATSIVRPSTTMATPLALPTTIQVDKDAKPQPQGGISPVAERLLIAAGVIVLTVALIATFLFCLQKRRGETLIMFINRKRSKSSPRPTIQPQTRQSRVDSYVEPPPVYTSNPEVFDYAANEKRIPIQRNMETFYTPGPPPPLVIPRPMTAFPTTEPPQQHIVSPLSPDERSVMPSYYGQQRKQSQDLYGVSPQYAKPPMSNLNKALVQNGRPQDPSPVYIANKNVTPSTYNNIFDPSSHGAKNYSPVTQVSNGYGNAGTQNTFATSNLDNPSQQENNRVSTLSSLSSGFGDGLIIIQDDNTIKYAPRDARKSKGQRTTRFSWQTNTSKAPSNDRTSTYTTMSTDTAPRFRSVNSWVAQQTGRVEREHMMASQIPAMPPVPKPLQKSVAPIKHHQRQESDISAFNYHPGQKLSMTPGSRVASSVLDTKLGHISRSTLG